MSCNGCRVLRKGCSESCILRPCLQWIDTPESQGHATVFVAKFFGRAGLMSFISNVPHNQRPALFQSLLYEACGRTVNPVSGAVGLLWTGNWHVCQAAVDTVLRGGTLRPIPEFLAGAPPSPPTGVDSDEVSEVVCPPQANTWQKRMVMMQDLNSITSNSPSPPPPRFTNSKRRKAVDERPEQLNLSLTPPPFPQPQQWISGEKRRPDTPSLNSEESATTMCFESGGEQYLQQVPEPRLLNLFV